MNERKCIAKYSNFFLSLLCSLPLQAETNRTSSTTAQQTLPLNAATTTLNRRTESISTPSTGFTSPKTQHWACAIIRVVSISWNHDNSRMAVGIVSGLKARPLINPDCGYSGFVQIFDTSNNTPRLLHTLNNGKDWVQSVKYNSDGSLLATGSRDGKTRIYDGQNPDLPVYTLHGNNPVMSIAYSHNGKKMAVGEENGDVTIYPGHHPALPEAVIKDAWRTVDNIAFAPDNSEMAIIGKRGAIVRTYRAKNKFEILRTLNDGKGVVNSVDYSPDSKWLAVGRSDYKVRLYSVGLDNNLQTKTGLMQTLTGATKPIKSLAFSPKRDKIRLAVASYDKKVRIYELDDHPDSGLREFRLRTTLEDAKALILSLAYSTDGNHLAVGDMYGKVYIYKINRHGIPEKTYNVLSIDSEKAVSVTAKETNVRPEILAYAPSAPGQPLAVLPGIKLTSSSSTITLTWLLLAGMIANQMF